MDLREVARDDRSALDPRHPWEEARAEFFLRVLEAEGRLGPDAPSVRVLDCGAGDGYVALKLRDQLPSESSIVCWDKSYDLARVASLEPRIRFVREAPNERFDVVLLLDVLEHVKDDAHFAADACRRFAKPGATVLVSVPAWQQLFSAHDRFLGHFRRYSPKSARAVLEKAGLEIVRSGGLFHSLVLLRLGIVAAERWRGEQEQNGVAAWRSPWPLHRMIKLGLAADTRLSWLLARHGIGLPGLSFFAVCRYAEDAG